MNVKKDNRNSFVLIAYARNMDIHCSPKYKDMSQKNNDEVAPMT